jgi:hypothetical protein
VPAAARPDPPAEQGTLQLHVREALLPIKRTTAQVLGPLRKSYCWWLPELSASKAVHVDK